MEMIKLILLQQNLQAQCDRNEQVAKEKAGRIEELASQVKESQAQAHRWQETKRGVLTRRQVACFDVV